MKKFTAYLLLAAIILSLCGCGQSKEAVTESSGDINAALKAYAALSEEDKVTFYEEISAEQQALKAAKLEALKPHIFGEWCKELNINDYGDSVFANTLLLNEDMSYEYGRQKGSWQLSDDGIIDLFNEEDGVCYFSFTLTEEDGFAKLICCDEEKSCYVLTTDYDAVWEKKYVCVKPLSFSEYFGELQYVGISDTPPGSSISSMPVYIRDSLAYDKGLIYVGCSSDFEMSYYIGEGEDTHFYGSSNYPFAFSTPGENDEEIRTEIKGQVYFIRSEYVEDVFFDEYYTRIVLLKNGSYFRDTGACMWEYLPEGTYEDFKY